MRAHQDDDGSGAPTGGGNQAATDRPWPDTVDYVYDHGVEGDLAANADVKGDDYTDIVGDHDLATNEIAEVTKIELIPPRSAGGGLQNFRYLRLWDGSENYPNIRAREFMLGYFGPDLSLTTPMLGTPVLAGNNDPNGDPVGTATPKYGPDTPISPRIQNDDTAITDSFRVRLHFWRWRGSDPDLQNYFQSVYGRTTFAQNISMSNPFKSGADRSGTYRRSNPVEIRPGAAGGALGQWTKLTGGVDQELPKVHPWMTWSENANATRTNTYYEFTTRNDRVDEDWKRLQHDFTNKKKAAFYTHLAVNEPTNLLEGQIDIEEREDNPVVQLTPNSAHELPILRPLDGAGRDDYTAGQLPVALGSRLGETPVIWNDGGGFQIKDDGTAIPANDVLVGVYGKRLQLES